MRAWLVSTRGPKVYFCCFSQGFYHLRATRVGGNDVLKVHAQVKIYRRVAVIWCVFWWIALVSISQSVIVALQYTTGLSYSLFAFSALALIRPPPNRWWRFNCSPKKSSSIWCTVMTVITWWCQCVVFGKVADRQEVRKLEIGPHQPSLQPGVSRPRSPRTVPRTPPGTHPQRLFRSIYWTEGSDGSSRTACACSRNTRKSMTIM